MRSSIDHHPSMLLVVVTLLCGGCAAAPTGTAVETLRTPVRASTPLPDGGPVYQIMSGS